MILTIRKDAPKQELTDFKKKMESMGLQIYKITGAGMNVIGLVGDTARYEEADVRLYDWITNVTRIQAPYKKTSRAMHPEDSIVDVCGVKFGGKNPVVVMAGPCAVESREQLMTIALGVKDSGARMLRGGAFKPRTSPYSFQGLGDEGLDLLLEAKKAYGLPIVTEIMSADKIDEFVEKVDLIQVGARNMQNFDLLKALGRTNKPILLKRGLSNTINEWLMSAEYILSEGNENVILCERGIRTFETATRNTLDVSVVPIVRKLTHLPIVVDPSHGTGHWDLVEPMALAAVTVGADGLEIEVHNDPEKALSDGGQSLKIDKFASLMDKAKKIAHVVGRKM